MVGMIFNIQRFSIHDGPGIRTTVFLKGCSLRCFWCHNPESINPSPELQVFVHKCIRCGRCAEVCPVKAHSIECGRKVFKRNLCIQCGKCAEICYAGALEMAGEKISVKEVVDEVEKDRAFYENSGGGVTFSGGEPLVQKEFLKELLAESKRRGLHTAVETAGNVPWEAFEEITPFTDLFLYDVKVMDSKKHKAATGSANKRCIGNLKKLAEKGANIHIRIPVISRVNDTQEDMHEIVEFVKTTGRSIPMELLPFHRMGEGKYASLDLEYKAKEYEAPTDEKLQKLKQVFEKGEG